MRGGAGTGLAGGVMPTVDSLVLSLARFNRILSLDVAACTARVEPGVRNLAISEAAAPHGLYYAPDPSSQHRREVWHGPRLVREGKQCC
ncbi:MAG: FAD-binding protein [Mariprofundaceae bacterium]|nr:FAD-binding protein [Mariprofundaceae bacterium]